MKRQGDLLEKIADMDNLQTAFYTASKGKSAKEDVFSYGKKIHENLRRLREEIQSGDIKVGGYRFFTVYDPKLREICAAPFSQRVLHHAVMNVCHHLFEKVQIFDSYANRKGKGTYAALKRAVYYTGRYEWFLKLDVQKYFDTIDHGVLKNQLNGIFKDMRLLAIFGLIIDSYHKTPEKGVPIGNLTSQYFANHYLAKSDRFIKENLRISGYVRYMDDMVLWHHDKQRLKDPGLHLRAFLKAELKLELRPFCLNHASRGLPFLGYLLFPDGIRLSHRSRSRFVHKLRFYKEQLVSSQWTQKEYQNHVMPLMAFTGHADAKGFRKKVLTGIN
jgi:RNA-directed DNA polymerase